MGLAWTRDEGLSDESLEPRASDEARADVLR